MASRKIFLGLEQGKLRGKFRLELGAEGHRSCGRLSCCFGEGLKPVQKIGCTLRMGGGAKYCPLVVVQHLEPALDVGRMIGARFGREFKVGA